MKIIHLKQQHKLPEGEISKSPSELSSELIIKSQFEIAKYILQHPGLPVLREAVTEDITKDVTQADDNHFFRSLNAKRIFPNGLPMEFDQLSATQKKCLYNEGGVFLLWYLGKLDKIYKSSHPEVSQKILKKINAKEKKGKNLIKIDYVFKHREQEVLVCAKETAELEYGSLDKAVIILVYGAGHDFKPLCDELGYEYETVDTGAENFSRENFLKEIEALENSLKLPITETASSPNRFFASASSSREEPVKESMPEKFYADFINNLNNISMQSIPNKEKKKQVLACTNDYLIHFKMHHIHLLRDLIDTLWQQTFDFLREKRKGCGYTSIWCEIVNLIQQKTEQLAKQSWEHLSLTDKDHVRVILSERSKREKDESGLEITGRSPCSLKLEELENKFGTSANFNRI